MSHRNRFIGLVLATAIAVAPACAGQQTPRRVSQPRVIPHAEWQAQPPLGHDADAARRNKAAGDSLRFRDLTVTVLATAVDSTGAQPVDVV